MKSNIRFITVAILTISILSCKAGHKQVNEKKITINDVVITLADSTEATSLIQYKDPDGFFDNIMPLDISIQMQSPATIDTRESALQKYSTFLAGQVSSWSSNDISILAPVLEKVVSISQKLAGRFMPVEINLVKIKTGHYGNDVYYTRGNSIMIPENVFSDFNPDIQLPILIHEIFHLISRNNMDLRDSLFKLIGFERLKKKVVLPAKLEANLLTNPDGAFRHHAITLQKDEGNKVLAIPLITSKFSKYKKDAPTFFEYLNFDLYELEDLQDGNYGVKAGINGQTTLDLGFTPSFFMKIRDNTQYIIHPEEIIADNFMLAALANHKKDFSRFSSNGKLLIDSLIEVFKKMN